MLATTALLPFLWFHLVVKSVVYNHGLL